MNFYDEWDIHGTARFLSRGYTRAALQFPDEHLNDCKAVASALSDSCSKLGHKVHVYILADTSYNSSGVDEVAAEHANADCIIHYGEASLSPLSRLPAYFVFRAAIIDVKVVARQVLEYASSLTHDAIPLVGSFDRLGGKQRFAEAVSEPIALLIMLHQPYAHAFTEMECQIDWQQQQQQQQQEAVSGDCANNGPASGARVEVLVCSARAGSLAPIGSPKPGGCGRLNTSDAAPAVTPDHGPRHCCSSSLQSCAACHRASSPGHLPPANGRSIDSDCQRSGSLTDNDARMEASEEPFDTAGMHTREETCTSCSTAAALTWQLPDGVSAENAAVVWVGSGDSSCLRTLQLAHSSSRWSVLDPETMRWQHGLPDGLRGILRRRYFLVEKARNANIVGILVGTLGVAGYLKAIDQLRHLIQQANKKTYTFLVGKPNPSKLANFPEVDIFVVIADPEGIIMDSREYYAPLLSPFEAYVAFSPGAEWTGDHRLDFNFLLQGSNGMEPCHDNDESAVGPRFSLLDGQLHGDAGEESTEHENESIAKVSALPVAVRPQMQLLNRSGGDIQITNAAQFLHNRRTYVGLHDHLTDDKAKPAGAIATGRAGRAAGYTAEYDYEARK